MADFQANIRAVLDTGGIENQIKNEINNRKIHFNNITLDTTDLVQKIQNALSTHQFTLNLGNINFNNISQQVNSAGQNAGQQFAHQFRPFIY